MKFTPENRKVIFEMATCSVKVKKDIPHGFRKIPGDVICISVSDTGPGISIENQACIFDRFYQVDSKHSRQFEGTGLGLALSKELVDLHHRKIKVER